MAMSFAPLAMLLNKIQIDNIAVVSKSYPAFWEDIISCGFEVNI
jgi:3-phosphoshikimate 1-carboxyvinyltransferase